jgi:hypothetical protein
MEHTNELCGYNEKLTNVNSRDGYIQPSYQACLSQVWGVTTSTTGESRSGSGRDFSYAPRHTLVNRYGGRNAFPQGKKARLAESTRVFMACCLSNHSHCTSSSKLPAVIVTTLKTVTVTNYRYSTNENRELWGALRMRQKRRSNQRRAWCNLHAAIWVHSRAFRVVWSPSSWQTHSRCNSPKDLQLTESQFSPAIARNTP